jgi:hypothetical protein
MAANNQIKFEPEDQIVYPTTDPNLPSFEDQSYVNRKDDLELVEDMFQGRSAWVRKHRIDSSKVARYLPIRAAEENDTYLPRVMSSPFHRFFGKAVERFSALSAQFVLNEDAHPTIEAAKENIDKEGSSLAKFKLKADELSIRDGWCAVLTEYTKPPLLTNEDGTERPLTRADEEALDLRPYLILVAREDIPNKDYTVNPQGQKVLKQITIRRFASVNQGDFGSESEIRFHTYTRDSDSVMLSIRRLIVAEDSADEASFELVPFENGDEFLTLQDINGTPLKEIPIVIYPDEVEKPPLLDMAENNLAFYQGYSNYWDGLNISSVPGLYRVWPGKIGEGQSFVWGPHHMNEVPGGGSVGLLEFQNSGAATMRQALLDLKEDIKEEGLAFLGQGSYAKTDDEIALKTAIAETTLASMATQTESAIQKVFEHWVNWLGETGTGGTIEVDKDSLRSPVTAQEFTALMDSVSMNALNPGLVEAKLKQRRWWPKGFDGEMLAGALIEQPAPTESPNAPLGL